MGEEISPAATKYCFGKQQPPGSLAVDRGVIFALADQSDSWHVRCVRFLDRYRGKLIVPRAVVPEACYLLNNYLGAAAEAAFVESLSRRELILDHFATEDLIRSVELLDQYDSLNLGFVDASVIAMCERRKILAILTTDRRHFSVVRSKLGSAFHLFP